MAKLSFVQQSDITENETFRSLGLRISQALDSFGFTKTADTGQIDWSTATRPLSSASMVGYEMRQFPAGTLQSANPVLIKIRYGSSSASAVILGMQFSVGRTTDGAGNFTGIYSSTISCYSGGNSPNGSLCFMSGDEEHLAIALFLGITNTTTAYHCIFCIDRLRDETGKALDTGINVFSKGNSSPSQFMLPSGSGAQFPATPLTNPMALFPPGASTAPTAGLGMSLSFLYPYIGCSGNPDLNVIIYPSLTMSAPGGTIIEITSYGAAHNYVLCGSYTAALNGNYSANWSVGVRYE